MLTNSSSDPQKYLRTILSNMKARCYNPKHESFPYYGARGVKIFNLWLNPAYFVADILALIGPRPTAEVRPNGLSVWELDRIDSYGNYEPGNVRWLRWEQNQKNKRQRISKPPAKAPRRLIMPGYSIEFVNATSGIIRMGR